MRIIKTVFILTAIIGFVSCSKDMTIQPTTLNQQQQTIPIPNGDFENWNSFPALYNWSTNSCPLCVTQLDQYVVKKDPDAHNGQFAAKFIYNNDYPALAENKFPVPYHPSNLTGYVKCNLYGTDTVYVQIKILYNSVTVDSGQWIGMASINNYTQINIPITQSATQIDSALISIQGGRESGYPNDNTEFWIDDLTLQ